MCAATFEGDGVKALLVVCLLEEGRVSEVVDDERVRLLRSMYRGVGCGDVEWEVKVLVVGSLYRCEATNCRWLRLGEGDGVIGISSGGGSAEGNGNGVWATCGAFEVDVRLGGVCTVSKGVVSISIGV